MGAIALVAVMGTSVLAGCSEQPSDEANVAAACTALSNLGTVVSTALTDLSGVETVGELKAIRESVSTAYEEANSAVSAVADDRAKALQEAWQEFEDQAQAIDDDSSLVEARDALLEEAQAFAGARESAESGLACA